jgi:hypothetical protein
MEETDIKEAVINIKISDFGSFVIDEDVEALADSYRKYEYLEDK